MSDADKVESSAIAEASASAGPAIASAPVAGEVLCVTLDDAMRAHRAFNHEAFHRRLMRAAPPSAVAAHPPGIAATATAPLTAGQILSPQPLALSAPHAEGFMVETSVGGHSPAAGAAERSRPGDLHGVLAVVATAAEERGIVSPARPQFGQIAASAAVPSRDAARRQPTVAAATSASVVDCRTAARDTARQWLARFGGDAPTVATGSATARLIQLQRGVPVAAAPSASSARMERTATLPAVAQRSPPCEASSAGSSGVVAATLPGLAPVDARPRAIWAPQSSASANAQQHLSRPRAVPVASARTAFTVAASSASASEEEHQRRLRELVAAAPPRASAAPPSSNRGTADRLYCTAPIFVAPAGMLPYHPVPKRLLRRRQQQPLQPLVSAANAGGGGATSTSAASAKLARLRQAQPPSQSHVADAAARSSDSESTPSSSGDADESYGALVTASRGATTEAQATAPVNLATLVGDSASSPDAASGAHDESSPPKRVGFSASSPRVVGIIAPEDEL
jgi:hypothetical protein